uniref:Uncharacterized protein n=1 Tax=Opuntia streptacantha TaxID=393608 RepID=A0A7C9AVW1_OPUST
MIVPIGREPSKQIAILRTQPARSKLHGGVSLQPPTKSTRTGNSTFTLRGMFCSSEPLGLLLLNAEEDTSWDASTSCCLKPYLTAKAVSSATEAQTLGSNSSASASSLQARRRSTFTWYARLLGTIFEL